MELIKPGLLIDFMKYRRAVVPVSMILLAASVVLAFVPGLNYGIDFSGGTEMQVEFNGDLRPAELRKILGTLGYKRADVVSVEGSNREFILRIQEVSSLSKAQIGKIKSSVRSRLSSSGMQGLKVSPGGDKLSLRFGSTADTNQIKRAIEAVGVQVRAVNAFGSSDQNRYEAHLMGVADKVLAGLGDKLGARGPQPARRVEWVGPKAGEQLRAAAIQSLLYAIAFIMLYVAFRFDLRFAPGGVLAMIHDAVLTIGIFVVLGKEVNLSTVAALLTIMGYSINDTIVIFDRIRENMSRYKDKGLRDLINISTSQMLSRSIMTSGTTVLSVSAFFIWGTPIIQDIAFAMIIGVLVGTYSSIYIAAPVTEWMDQRFFRRA